MLISWVIGPGCASTDPAPAKPPTVDAAPVDHDGIRFFRGKPGNGRLYVALGYVRYETRTPGLRDRVLSELSQRALDFGGNAVIDLAVETVLETETGGATFGTGIGGDLRRMETGTMSNLYRWTGTVVLLK